jgi:hypothetical protein
MTESAEPEFIDLLPLSEPALAAFLQRPTTGGHTRHKLSSQYL